MSSASATDHAARDWEWLRRVMTDPQLSPADRNVAFLIHAHARKGDRKAWPAVTTLALLTGLSDRTVQKALKHLVAVGWLSVDEKPGKASAYALRFDQRFLDLPSFEERRAEVRGEANSPPTPAQGGEEFSGDPRRCFGGGAKNFRGTPEDVSDEPLQVTPTENPSKEPNGGGTQRRGSRIPDDWQPTDDGRQILLGKGFDEAEIAAEAENFRDHWLAEPGKKGIKLDWKATWRKWCRSDYCRPKTKRSRQTGDGFFAALTGAEPSNTPCGTVIDIDSHRITGAGR